MISPGAAGAVQVEGRMTAATGGAGTSGTTGSDPAGALHPSEHLGQQLAQHLAGSLAHGRDPLGFAHDTALRAAVAASAAVRTSASAPVRYTRPVAPIIR